MQKGRIEFDDPNFRPAAKSTIPAAFLQFAEPFARIANLIDVLPAAKMIRDDEPVRGYVPGAWPTVGDARRLRDELVRLGWKP